MKEFIKKYWQMVLPAIMSLIVICANLTRLVFDHSPDKILHVIAAVASSVVALMVFVVAATALLRHSKLETFEEVLDTELDSFVSRHAPFISVINDYEGAGDTDGALYGMLEHHEDILKKGEVFPDELYTPFFSLPADFSTGNQIVFFFDEDTFEAALKEKNIGDIDDLRKDIANAVSAEFSGIVKAHAFSEVGDNRMFINFSKDFDTPEEARELIHLLDYVFVHYLALA